MHLDISKITIKEKHRNNYTLGNEFCECIFLFKSICVCKQISNICGILGVENILFYYNLIWFYMTWRINIFNLHSRLLGQCLSYFLHRIIYVWSLYSIEIWLCCNIHKTKFETIGLIYCNVLYQIDILLQKCDIIAVAYPYCNFALSFEKMNLVHKFISF